MLLEASKLHIVRYDYTTSWEGFSYGPPSWVSWGLGGLPQVLTLQRSAIKTRPSMQGRRRMGNNGGDE